MNDFHEVRVFAISVEMTMPKTDGEVDMDHFINFMAGRIVDDCGRTGMTFLGHLKGVVRDHTDGFLRFNLTQPGKPVSVDGVWSGKGGKFVMDLNVLLFGISQESLSDVCLEAIKGICQEMGIDWAVLNDNSYEDGRHAHCASKP